MSHYNRYNRNSVDNGAELKENRDRGAGGDLSNARGDLSSAAFAAWALGVLALAAALRFAFATRYEIWLDEAYCFSVAARSVPGIIGALRLDNGPPLYYILLHFWMRFFGESPLALRSLSALFSLASVAVILFWRTPWLTRRTRVLAGLVLAITPLALYYAQEARMYSPVTFFCLLAIVFLERALRRGGGGNWGLFALFTALSLYTSYIAIFLVPLGYAALAAALAGGLDRKVFIRRLALLLCAHAAAAAVFLPWLGIFMHQPRPEAIQWIERLPNRPNAAVMALESLSVMTVGGAKYPAYLRQLRMDDARFNATVREIELGRETRPLTRLLALLSPNIARTLGALLTLALLAAALRRPAGEFPARTFLVAWVLGPIAAPLLLSLQRPMYLVGRYEITALPAMAILAGIALARLKVGARTGALVLALLLAFYSWGWAQVFQETGRQPARGAYIREIAAEGDVVLAEAFEYAPIWYYMGAARARVEFVTYPRDTVNHSAWIDYRRWLKPVLDGEAPRIELYKEAQLTIEEALGRVAPGGTVIIVRPRPPLPLPPWAAAMEGPLIAAVDDVSPGKLALDRDLSKPQMRIIVYHRILEESSALP